MVQDIVSSGEGKGMSVFGRRMGIFLGLVFLLLSGLGGCCTTPDGLEIKYYYTRTEDNITLGLKRFKPAVVAADTDPVILCHGFSYNMLFWDLADEVSLPRYLAEAGYDVWLLSLRGSAPSSQPILSSVRKLAHFHFDPEMLKIRQNRLKDMAMLDWSVDDHILYDLPTAISFVREQTGHEQVHWVGHSMGAMTMFGYLGYEPGAKAKEINSFVAIAAPMVVFHPLSDPLSFLLEQEKVLAVGSTIIGSSAPATLGTIFGNMDTPMDKLFYNGTNMNGLVLRALFQQAEEEMGPSQFKQLLEMVRSERFWSLDKTTDYTSLLGEVKTPTFLLAGTVDNMATPESVRYIWRNIGSKDKKFRLYGRVNSYRNDYGHNDLVIGEHVRREVYPEILAWLEAHGRD